MGYFDSFTNTHRMASEHLMSAVETGEIVVLDKAKEYGVLSVNNAGSDAETVLARGILDTIEKVREVLRGAGSA